jgi:outer membrane protein TolC
MPLLTRWLILTLLLPIASHPIFAQPLSLEQANRLARENYPAIRQKDLIRQTSELTLTNLSKNFLPQISISAQASYQSDVTAVHVPIPGIKIDAPEKDQYRAVADVSQMIFDGGTTRQQKMLQQLNSKTEDQAVEVELFRLQDRINQVFLGVLYTDEQIRQVDLVKQDLQTGMQRVEAQFKNGTSLRSNVSALQAELIKVEQRRIELLAMRNSLLQTLALFINRPLDSTARLEMPSVAKSTDTTIRRPELTWYELQANAIAQQNKLVNARNLPRTSLFAQAGYGRPGLNMLKNQFDLFYLTGIRFNWSLGGLYTARNERKILNLNQEVVNVKRDVFLLNTRSDIRRQENEISKLEQLIESDHEIILLRKSVTRASKAQLENGVATANDYLREVNAEDMARQTLLTHEIQLLQARLALAMLQGK